MSSLYKNRKLKNNFKLIVVSSYITEIIITLRVCRHIFLENSLENYIKVLKKKL